LANDLNRLPGLTPRAVKRHPGPGLSDADRERLVAEHSALVRALARRYARRGEPLEDLVQVGMVGLLKAIDRYDSSRGSTLATFATPTILGEIRRHFRDHLRPVHVPRSLQDAQANVNRAISDLTGTLGRSPSVRDIAKHLQIQEDEVLDALAANSAFHPDSLSHSPTDDGQPFEIRFDEAGYERAEGRVGLAASLKQLPERERMILIMRFAQGLTQSQIAERVGVSQMHISRLIRQAVVLLRQSMGEEA
jgi:RNA polymerase sigma-B factor